MTTHRAAARAGARVSLRQEARHGQSLDAREQLPAGGGDRTAGRWSAVWLRLREGWCLANGGHVWRLRLRRAGLVRRCVACGAVRLVGEAG